MWEEGSWDGEVGVSLCKITVPIKPIFLFLYFALGTSCGSITLFAWVEKEEEEEEVGTGALCW